MSFSIDIGWFCFEKVDVQTKDAKSTRKNRLELNASKYERSEMFTDVTKKKRRAHALKYFHYYF